MNSTHFDSSSLKITRLVKPDIWKLGGTEILILGLTAVVAGQLLSYAQYYLFENVKAPFVGHRSWLEPSWLVRMRYMTQSASMIQEGYNKYKNTFFKVRRNDNDILVIPNRFVNELHNLSPQMMNGSQALFHNHLGYLADMELMLESDLHLRAVRAKITPNLGNLLPAMEDEIEHSFRLELPDFEGADKWQEISLNEGLLRTSSRVASRLFMGAKVSRNDCWINLTVHYTEDLFTTVVLLRMFPSYLHRVLARALPSYWRMRKGISLAKQIVGEVVRERRDSENNGDSKPDDLLSWMMDKAATDQERDPEELGNRTLILSMASIHTVCMAALHTLYDVVARPEYLEALREEMISALREDQGWKKTTMSKLRKLDSFMKESQRLNPLSQLGFNRYVRRPFTLSDGTHLPAGTQFNCAAAAISLDREFVPGPCDPDVFDPWRWSRLREESPENINKFQFAMTSSDSLHFGHGRQACPGRFLASDEIKMMLVKLLLRYDFRYPDGFDRPKNLTADENVFPDPSATLLMRPHKLDEKISGLLGI